MSIAHTDLGPIRIHGDGRVTLKGLMPALCRKIDRRVRELARDAGAQELSGPAIIERSVLERAGYFDAFPGGATMLADGRYALQPAACYHCYAELAGTPIDRLVLTLAGRCYRHHDARLEGATRLWEFTMREVVLIGKAEWVQSERPLWIDRVTQLARELGVDVNVQVATDSFYGPSSRGKRVLQQLKELKHEIRAEVDGEDLAIASVNLHETFFATRFDLRGTDGAAAYTACTAFGLERWVAAILAHRGEAFAAGLAAQEQ